MAAENYTLDIGTKFSTFDDFQTALSAYQSDKGVQYWRRDARTVAAAAKRVNRPLNGRIQYYELRYCCIHGGQKFTSRSTGARNTS